MGLAQTFGHLSSFSTVKFGNFCQPPPVLRTFLPPCENSGIFQETSDRAGVIPCRWLPLFTSKQRESPLSYAHHFLRIISHQMCCAGERAEGRTEGSLHHPGGTAGAAGAFLRAVRGNRLCALIPNWEKRETEKKTGRKARSAFLTGGDGLAELFICSGTKTFGTS